MKAYFWKCDVDAEGGVAVIADNAKEAKQMGWDWWGKEVGHETHDAWIHQRINLTKDKNIKGLPKGVVDDWIEGLKRNIYGFVEEECPICKKYVYIYCESDKIGCHDCLYPEEKELEKGGSK